MVQQVLVVLIFLAALAYLGWRTWKSLDRSQSGGCAKGCGCEADKAISTKRH